MYPIPSCSKSRAPLTMMRLQHYASILFSSLKLNNNGSNFSHYDGDWIQRGASALQLHGPDHPGMVLVTAALTGNNYLNWSFRIKRALRAKMKIGFIDGSSVKPHASDPHFEQWIRVDSMVTTWILNSISREIVEAFMYTKSSRSLWLDLEQRYGDCNGPQLYQLQREICSMTQGNLPLSTYFMNMKRLWDEMGELKPTPQCTCNGCTCGAWNTVAESAAFTQLMQFLMGLNDTFDSVRHQLLVMDPTPTVNKAYSLIQSVEKQRRVHVELADNVKNIALNIRSGSRFDKKRYNADKRTLHCTHCNKMGHSRDTCFRLHGTPDWYKELTRRRNRDMGSTKAYNVGTITRPENQMQHNTKEELLQELMRLMKNNVQPEVQGNLAHEDDFAGMNVAFTSSRNNILSSWIVNTRATNHMCGNTCFLENLIALKNPTLVHLLDGSTHSVTHTGTITLHKNFILTNSKRIIVVDNQAGNLYFVDKSSFNSNVIQSCINNQFSCLTSHDCIDFLWHLRLGHPSSIVMQNIPDVKTTTPSRDLNCEIGPIAKQHRLPFPSSSITSTSIFELLHTDLWGPYHQSSLTANFLAMVKTQFHTSVKCIRSDNGFEFNNSQCQSLFLSYGIINQTSCSYTPQQNGVVERKHRHVLQVARALLFQAHLPQKFWGESILTATYLINRLPMSVLHWKSLFEIFYNKPPNLNHIKNAYKVYDLDRHISFAFRDVTFRESSFPFNSAHSKSDSVCLPIPFDDVETPCDAPVSTPPPFDFIHVTTPSTPTLRRSQRTHSKPSWLTDYICNCSYYATSCTPSSYSAAHRCFVANLSALQEPKSYLQASKDEHWALAANRTWTYTSLPPGEKTIGSHWVFKLKLKPNGSIDRYKARSVAKGYNQIEGVDYFDSFSPVAKSVTVRVFLSLAASKSWPLMQLDINNTFLCGSFNEHVYMDPLEGLLDMSASHVCKLQKSLYDLKQAFRQWNLELTCKLLEFDFSQSCHEHCLFIKRSAGEYTALLVYVDDILLTGSSPAALQSVKDYLHRLFTIKNLGAAKYFLGLELARSQHGILVSQYKYLQDILSDAFMVNAKPAPTPLPIGLKLVLDDGCLLADPGRFRRLVGRLLYLGFTRPDISFAVQQLSQFLQAPRSSHWDAALHVLRYLKGTPSSGLFFSSASSFQFRAYFDASWASFLDSRRSIIGFCVFLGSSLISWKTKK
ncbi:UNVERIFIED_CONTAM: Retrovirus-related Pol polyprotein from transposon RE1 [Sesamum indicum]